MRVDPTGKYVFVPLAFAPPMVGQFPQQYNIDLYKLPDGNKPRVALDKRIFVESCVVLLKTSDYYFTGWSNLLYHGFSVYDSFHTEKETCTKIAKLRPDLTFWYVGYDQMYQVDPLPSDFVEHNESKNNDYPHTCPRCKSSAYIGFSNIECTGINCQNFCLKK